MAIAVLTKRGLAIQHIEVDGRRGRQVVIDCSAQRFEATPIASQPEEIEYGTS